MKKLLLVPFFLLFITVRLMAVDYYWVGGTGNWSDLSHWVTTSGGNVGLIIIPTANDNVHFDGNSFTQTGQTVTITDGGGDANMVCRNMDWTGANFNPTLLGYSNQTLHIYGFLTLIPTMTYSFAGSVYFEASDLGNKVTGAGKVFQNSVVFQGKGGWTLGDDLSVNSLIMFNNGELLAAGHNISCNDFSSDTSTARHLDISGTLFTITGNFKLNSTHLQLNAVGSLVQNNSSADLSFWITGSDMLTFADINIDNGYPGVCVGGNPCSVSFGTPITINKLKLSGNIIRFIQHDNDPSVAVSIETVEFSGACTKEFEQPNDYHINHLLANEGTQVVINCNSNDQVEDAVFNGSYVTINGSSSHFISANFNCSASINGTNTFEHLRFSGGNIYTIGSGSKQTINNQIELSGTCSSVIIVHSSIGGTPCTFDKGSGLVEGKYLSLKDIHVTGGATFIANNTVDLGNNTGWTINGASPLNLHWVGNSGNWSDIRHWSLVSGGAGGACLPTAFDNVYFDHNSFTSSGQTVTVDVSAAVCHNIDWTGALNNPVFAGTSECKLMIYGSLTFIPAMTNNFKGSVCFEASDSGNKVTSGGQAFQSDVVFEWIGSWTLGDDLSVKGQLILNIGELLVAGHPISCNGFSSDTYTVRHLDIGKSLFTVTGNFKLNSTNFHLDAAGSLVQNNSSYGFSFWIIGWDLLSFANINVDNVLVDDCKFCSVSIGAPINIEKLTLSGNHIEVTQFENARFVPVNIDSLEFNGPCIKNVSEINDYHINHILANEGTNVYVDFNANDYIGDAVFNGSYATLGGSSSHFNSANINCSASINGTSSTFDHLRFSGGNIYTISAGSKLTINDKFELEGTCRSPINILSSSNGNPCTISKASGLVEGTYLSLQDVQTTGGATFKANNSVDLGDNTGWIINGAVPLNLYWVGGTGNWSDFRHWSLISGGAGGDCLPTAYDNVYFDQHSFTSSGQTVTVDVDAAVCHNMDWTGSLNNPVFTGTGVRQLMIYGSLTFIPGMTNDFGGLVYFEATDLGNVIRSSGKAFNNLAEFRGTGSWTLRDDLSVNGQLTMDNGELLVAGHKISCYNFWSIGTTKRHLDIKDAIFTIIGGVELNSTNFHLEAAGSLIQYNGNYTLFVITGDDLLEFANINIFNNSWLCSDSGVGVLQVSLGAPMNIGKLKLSGNYIEFKRAWGTGSFPINIDSLEISGTCTKEIEQLNDYHINHLLANEGTNVIINCNENDYFGDAVFNGSYVVINGSSTHFVSANLNCSASINGTNTFDKIVFNPGHSYLLESNITQFITNSISIRGNNCFPIQIHSTIQGQQASLSKPGGIVSGDFLEIKDINATGGASFNAGVFSTDLGNNSGWAFKNAPDYIYGLGPDKSLCVGESLMTTDFNGAISYLWQDGSTSPYYVITKPGVYKVKATYSENCFYSDEIVIDTKSTPVASIVIAEPLICAGKSVQLVANVSGGTVPYNYSWLPSTGLDNSSILNPVASPATTTDYIFSATGANGCSSRDTIRVNIASPIEVSLTNTAPTACNSLTGTTSATVLGGRPYKNKTPYIFDWNTNPVKNTAILTGISAGSYVVTVSDSLGCSGQAVAILNDPGAPVVTLSLDNNTICSSISATATASGADLYEFFVDGIANGAASSVSTLKLSGLDPGVYLVSVKGTQSGCIGASAVIPLTVSDGLNATGSITGGSTICAGSTSGLLTLSGYSGTVEKWQSSVSPFITWVDIDNKTTSYTSGVLTETTQFRAVLQNGNCATPNSFPVSTITVNSSVIPTITGATNTSIDESYDYTTEASMTSYVWTISSGGTITGGIGTNSVTVKWNGLGANTLSVKYVNSNGCIVNGAVKDILVNSLTSPTITGMSTVCAETADVKYTTESGMIGYSWTISDGGKIIAGATTNEITVLWNTTGNQKISVNYQNTEGSSAIAATTLNVTVNPLPVPTISIPDTTWVGASYIYSTEANMTNYNWIVSTGGIISSGKGTNSATIQWLIPGWRALSVNYVNENGCTSKSATMQKIKVINPPLRLTEGFSPNGDGINDLLLFEGLENYKGTQLIIFTRDGQKIYESDDYMNDWDGKFFNNGSKDKVTVIRGTYYYILKLGGTNRTFKGFIYIGY